MKPNAALAKNLAQALAPKVRDTRKFRLAKPMVFKPEEAILVATAFRQARVMSGNEKLTMAEFVSALCGNLGGETSPAEVEEVLKEVFVVQGGAVPTILA